MRASCGSALTGSGSEPASTSHLNRSAVPLTRALRRSREVSRCYVVVLCAYPICWSAPSISPRIAGSSIVAGVV